MDEVLQNISYDTINRVQKSLDRLYCELNLFLGEDRFKHDIYINVLWLSNLIDDEYIRRRTTEAEEVNRHNLNYKYKDNQE